MYYPFYWFSADFFKNFIVDTGNIIVFDDKKTLETIYGRPTLFLANHTSSMDPAHIHLALQREFRKYNIPMKNRAVRSIARDDLFLKAGRGKLANNVFNSLLEQSGCILVKRVDSNNTKKRTKSFFDIASTLKEGAHIHVYPMAGFSKDGTIDYIKNPDYILFDQDILRKIAKRVDGAFIQSIHYTVDPVYEKFLVSLGNPKFLTQDINYDFLKDMSECTTITALQIFSVYKDIASRNKITITDEKKSKDMNSIVKILTEKKFRVYTPGEHLYEDIATHYEDCASGNKKPYSIKYGKQWLRIDDFDYQRNQIKHLSIDTIINGVLHEHVH